MNKKIMFAILGVLVVGIVALVTYPVVKDYMITKDPINHIMYSSVKTGEEKNVSATVSVKAELDEKLAVERGIFDYSSESPEDMAKFANALLKNFEILYNLNMITDDDESVFKVDADLGMNYSGKNLINGQIKIKPWEAVIKVPEFYDKPFYIDINEAMKQEGLEFSLEDIDIKAYLDLIQKEDDLYKAVAENYEPYKDVIYNYLDGKVEKLDDNTATLNANGEQKEIKVTKYKINLNILEIYDLYGDLLKIAKDDEAVKALVVSRVGEFKNLVIKNKDYEKVGLTEEEFNEGMKEVEDQIVNNWDEGIENIITELKAIPSMPEMAALKNFDTSYVMAIDKDHMIRQVELGMQTEFIKMTEVVSYNAFGNDVKVNMEENNDDKVDVLKLAEDEAKAQQIVQEVISNIGSELLGGEAVATLVSDIKTESKVLPANESEEIINSIDMMLNQAQMFLPFMIQGMGL